MYIYLSPIHLLVAIPIIFTLVSLLCAYITSDKVKAMWWFMTMIFSAGASLLSIIWFVVTK